MPVVEYVMDFAVIWPLLRKEGWTWKAATGIQIHHNYVKRGQEVKVGKQGVEYFDGEGELLAYVRSDKDLCTRLRIANIMVRPNYQANTTVTSLKLIPSNQAGLQNSGNPRLAKRAKKAAKPSSNTTKKPTKKQIAEVAKRRSRELAAFDKVWGGENSTAADEKVVEPPTTDPPENGQSLISQDNTEGIKNGNQTANADTDVISPCRNADQNVPPTSNADKDTVPSCGNADKVTPSGAKSPSGNAGTDSISRTEEEGSLVKGQADRDVYSGNGDALESEGAAYDPDDGQSVDLAHESADEETKI
ncbi:hypothetical protein PHMEG_00010642 [Phytophthora megakarya]|uniref:Uncharacterized protein n=1 Tax=Phytophthora megakarya TaxID=4795 RepID=A0A225WDR9_9STRA|nr:hypothetical protein PHMEG_00010642 [Phytophthora megakarya]